jgi:hypothetical protein
MPHFYKLTDGSNNLRGFKEEWLDIVKFTMKDFIYGCNRDVIILICNLTDYELTRREEIEFKYEYFTIDTILPKNIKKVLGPYNDDTIDTVSTGLYEYLAKRNYYIHITCESFFDNIKIHGIVEAKSELGRLLNLQLIGSREDEEEKEVTAPGREEEKEKTTATVISAPVIPSLVKKKGMIVRGGNRKTNKTKKRKIFKNNRKKTKKFKKKKKISNNKLIIS